MRIVFFIFVILLVFVKYSGTKAAVADTLRFAFLTDLHVTPGNENDSGLHQIVKEINKLKLDFVVVTGDLTNTGSNEELYAVDKALKELRNKIYVIPGNHETNWSETAGLKFNEIWKSDGFSFSSKNFNFIGLNTGPYMRMGDGMVKNEDVLWLNEKIKQFNQTDKNLIAFTHYPLDDGLDNWPEITQILKNGHCKLVFCGHGHKLKIFNFNGIPGIMGRALFMKNEESPGYQIVEIRNDSVLIFTQTLAQTCTKSTIQINYQHPDTLKKIKTSPLPDFSINQEYPKANPFFEYQDSSSIFSGLAIYKNKNLIYGNSIGEVKNIDLLTKKVMWKRKFNGPIYSTPQIYNKTVILGTSDGILVGLDAENGKIIWQKSFNKPILAEGITENNYIYIGCADTAFVKIEANSGKIMWQFTEIKGIIQGKPALSSKYVVFGAWDKNLYCLNKETGQLVWKWNNGKNNKLYSPGNIAPAVSNGKVFIVAPDRYMTALDLQTGKEIWRTNSFQVRESMGISRDGKTIYAKLMNDSVIAVSAVSDKFELQWAVNMEFGYEHSPCPIAQTNNSVVLTTKDGMVDVIDQKDKKISWKHKSNNFSANKILIDQNKNIWISFMNGQINGFKLKY